ncbi:hypothetical protein [Stappia sp. ICDLI1TA098]
MADGKDAKSKGAGGAGQDAAKGISPAARAREERLAAALRANLRRRKAAGAAQPAAGDKGDDDGTAQT